MPWTPEEQKATEDLVTAILGMFPTTGTAVTPRQAIGPTTLLLIGVIVVVLVMRK